MVTRKNTMKKLISIIFISLFLSSTAYAKVTLNNSVMTDDHLYTIKGMLYDVTHTEEAIKDKETNKALPKLARAITWINDCHGSKKVYRLEQIKTEEAKTIINAVKVILNVTNGKYPGFPVEEAMARWHNLGTRITVQYAKTKEKVTWKFELLPEEKQTNNLVLKHDAEVKEIKIN